MGFRSFLLGAILTVTGCASEIMGGMVGQDVTQVVTRYGPPINVFDLPDGRRAFQWRTDDAIVMPTTTTYNAYGYGNMVSGSAMTTGGYLGSQTCFYTLYGKPNGKSWTIIGFEKPTLACE